MNKLNEKIFRKVLTNQRKCDILYIEIKKGDRKTMKEIKFYVSDDKIFTSICTKII